MAQTGCDFTSYSGCIHKTSKSFSFTTGLREACLSANVKFDCKLKHH